MALNHTDRIKAYQELLEQQPGELNVLFDDILHFFRDAAVFDSLVERGLPLTSRSSSGLHHSQAVRRRVLLWDSYAVAKSAMETGVAQKPIDLDKYEQQLENCSISSAIRN